MIRLTGLAAVYDRVDRAGDVIRAGAFGAVTPVPLLRQHRGKPVGEILTLREEGGGLRVEARIHEAEAARLVACGALPGLSVGYRPRIVRQGARREIVRADLVEVSLVAVPMQPAARVETVETI